MAVFPYLGKQISDELEPEKIYYVYRPPEELFSKEAIDSFNENPVPLVDNHTMIGDGFTPAEQKGIHGVISNIHRENDQLVGDLAIYSDSMKRQIEGGKKDLSMGYFCTYDLQEGFYNGQHYDAIQRDLRSNHVALVDEGRCGRSVRVYDSWSFDCMFENTALDDFKEEDHPREKNGQFASKGEGGGGSGSSSENSNTSSNQSLKNSYHLNVLKNLQSEDYLKNLYKEKGKEEAWKTISLMKGELYDKYDEVAGRYAKLSDKHLTASNSKTLTPELEKEYKEAQEQWKEFLKIDEVCETARKKIGWASKAEEKAAEKERISKSTDPDDIYTVVNEKADKASYNLGDWAASKAANDIKENRTTKEEVSKRLEEAESIINDSIEKHLKLIKDCEEKGDTETAAQWRKNLEKLHEKNKKLRDEAIETRKAIEKSIGEKLPQTSQKYLPFLSDEGKEQTKEAYKYFAKADSKKLVEEKGEEGAINDIKEKQNIVGKHIKELKESQNYFKDRYDEQSVRDLQRQINELEYAYYYGNSVLSEINYKKYPNPIFNDKNQEEVERALKGLYSDSIKNAASKSVGDLEYSLKRIDEREKIIDGKEKKFSKAAEFYKKNGDTILHGIMSKQLNHIQSWQKKIKAEIPKAKELAKFYCDQTKEFHERLEKGEEHESIYKDQWPKEQEFLKQLDQKYKNKSQDEAIKELTNTTSNSGLIASTDAWIDQSKLEELKKMIDKDKLNALKELVQLLESDSPVTDAEEDKEAELPSLPDEEAKDEEVLEGEEKKEDEETVKDGEEEKISDLVEKKVQDALDALDLNAIIEEKQELVAKVRPLVGDFNYSRMTNADIAKYACDHLELKASKTTAQDVLNCYLKIKGSKKMYLSEDSSSDNTDDIINKYMKGE